MASGSLTDSLRETLALFDGTPRTTTEVAEQLDLGRRSTYDRLERLVEHGRLETKKVGASARVWWRPAAADGADRPAADGADRPAAAGSADRPPAGDAADGPAAGDDPDRAERVPAASERERPGLADLPGMVYRCRNETGRPMAFVSDACADLTGYGADAVASGAVGWGEDVVHPDDRDRVREAVQSGLERDGEFAVKYRVLTADGETRRVREWGRRVDDRGDAATVVGFVTDLADRKTGERALRVERERFRTLVDSVEEYAIFTLDADGGILTWNGGAARIKGYDREEILGRNLSTFYTDDDRAAGVPRENLAAAAEDGSVEDEGWRVRKDGSRFWAHVTITALRDDDGDLRGYVKVTRDTTDRREREQAVRRERNLLENVLETTPTGVAIFDADGEARRVNRRFAELFCLDGTGGAGYALGDRSVRDTSGTVVPYRERPAPRALATGERVDRRVRIDGPGDRKRWLSVTAEPLDDAAGVVVAATDVTPLKERARRLQRRREELESELEGVFERVDDGFYALDGELRFTYVNERASALLGRPAGELVGEHVWDEFEPVAVAEAAFEEALDTQESVSFEEFYEPLGAWFEAHVHPSETGLSVYFRDVTERKEREEQLERYAGILDAVGEPAYELDAEGRFTFVNEAFVECSGYDESELLGRHISVGVDDEVVARAESLVADLLAEGGDGTAALEYEITTSDGERLPVENRFSLLTDDEGRLRGSAGMLWDVSEREARERELQRYETVVESIDDGVYVVDEEGRFTWVNRAYAEMTGYPGDELVGEHVSLVVAGEVVEAAREHEAALRAAEPTPDVLEADLQTADGGSFPAAASFAVFDGDDDEQRRVGVVRDVTERKARERELERSERRYRTLVDNFPNGAVVLFDEDLRYLAVGGEIYEGLSFSGDDLEGDTMAERLPGELYDGLEPAYRAVFDGEERDFEFAFDGEVRHFRVRPVHDEDGAVFAGMAMTQDVTERVERERRLDRQREQLAALNNLNEVVRETTDAVVDQSTREEIEATVCDHLAATDSYLFAWTGEVDVASETVTLRTEAGVEGYLDGVTISVDPDDEHSQGPTGRALRTGEIQTARDVQSDPDYEPWHDHADAHGVRSSAAIPIVHDDTVYGVLNVYAARPDAFEGQERTVIGQLGEVVGHAIAAAERKRALMSDEVVELEFRFRDAVEAVDVDCAGDGTVTVDHAVPVSDGEFLVYGTATAEGVGAVEALVGALPHCTDVTFRSDGGDGGGGTGRGFELRLSEPPVLSRVASVGGAVEEAVLEDGDFRVTLHLSPGVDVRRVTDAVAETYPDAEMVKRRQTARCEEPPESLRRVLGDELTDRQRVALEVAYHADFFEWPRGVTGEEVAESLGVSSPTFHQHLRAAERKVFASLLSSAGPGT